MTVLEAVWRLKWHLDLGISRVSWATGKLPEVMAILYLFEKLGRPISQGMVIPLVMGMFAALLLIGYLWKRLGFYDTERHVETRKDPIMDEVYRAAKRTNRRRR